eukprot:m.7595 g.7595  ORF g.7595 m.7595 type:complete len:224 (+) comp3740_c0_seq1:165-836(+)
MTFGRIFGAIWNQSKRVMKDTVTPADFGPPKPRILADFTKQAELENWRTSSDKAIGGTSTVNLEYKNGCTRLFGNLSTEIPKDSRVTRSGYINLRTVGLTPSIFGDTYYDLSSYNGLELLLKGDGRTYIMNLQTSSMQQEDLHQSFIYTRGGPELQKIRIPFSDFLLTNMGYVQNEQPLMNTSEIKTLGFLLADRLDGPYNLNLYSITAVHLSKEVTDMDVTS